MQEARDASPTVRLTISFDGGGLALLVGNCTKPSQEIRSAVQKHRHYAKTKRFEDGDPYGCLSRSSATAGPPFVENHTNVPVRLRTYLREVL